LFLRRLYERTLNEGNPATLGDNVICPAGNPHTWGDHLFSEVIMSVFFIWDCISESVQKQLASLQWGRHHRKLKPPGSALNELESPKEMERIMKEAGKGVKL
jgi:hypothetical protein